MIVKNVLLTFDTSNKVQTNLIQKLRKKDISKDFFHFAKRT